MAGTGRPQQRATLPSQELLDDLCSRFVLNAPEEELQSFERILFLVEQAHWFYEDNTMEQNVSLKSLTLRDFTSLMFQSCAALRPYIAHIDDIYKDFTTYKIRVPVTGAIILDESFERCLLVKGWKPGASWSFPRGKKNKDEEDRNCAIREVWEETGFDVSGILQVDEFLEVVIGQQRMRLYIIPGVREDTSFAPQTKKEISEIAWHRVDELPVASNETQSHNRGPTGLKYFMVWPFVGFLKNWIYDHRAAVSAPKTETSSKGNFAISISKCSTTIYPTKDCLSTYCVLQPGLNALVVSKQCRAYHATDQPGLMWTEDGTTVWKVKPNGGSCTSTNAGILIPPTDAPAVTAPSAVTVPSAVTAPSADGTSVCQPLQEIAGVSFRNFRFDRATVLQKLEV